MALHPYVSEAVSKRCMWKLKMKLA